MNRRTGRGLAARFVLAALLPAGLAVAVLAGGVAIVGGDAFRALMLSAGE